MENKEFKPIYEHKVMDMITPLHIQVRVFELVSRIEKKRLQDQWILDVEEKLNSIGFTLEQINLEDMRDNESQKMLSSSFTFLLTQSIF